MRLAAATGIKVGDAITSPRFIGLYAACFICAFGLFVPFVHLVPYALDHGVPPSAAVLLIGMIGVGSTVGRSARRPRRPARAAAVVYDDVSRHGIVVRRVAVAEASGRWSCLPRSLACSTAAL